MQYKIILSCLISQGLTDTEEFVVCKALNALTGLTELGLLQKSTLYDFTADIVVLLCHPVSNKVKYQYQKIISRNKE